MFHHGTSLPRPAPVMGEAEEVKRVRLVSPMRPRRFRSRSKADQPRFVGVNGQTVFLKTFWEYLHYTSGILFTGEAQYEVVRVTDQEYAASKARLHFLLDPFVKHIVQINVRQ